MSPEETKQLKAIIATTAFYYSQQVRDEVLQMMADDLSDLNFGLVIKAYADIRKDPKCQRFPIPSQIRVKVSPTITDDEQAKRIAETAIGCVTKYGWPNPDEARKEIGEIGWAVIQRRGGWSEFCKDADSDHIFSQIRDGAIVELKSTQGARHALELSDSNKHLLPESRGEMRSMQEMLALVKPKGA